MGKGTDIQGLREQIIANGRIMFQSTAKNTDLDVLVLGTPNGLDSSLYHAVLHDGGESKVSAASDLTIESALQTLLEKMAKLAAHSVTTKKFLVTKA